MALINADILEHDKKMSLEMDSDLQINLFVKSAE